jgi:hypothetical protein
VVGKEKEKQRNSPSGNRTRVTRVTGGYTNHYTNEEVRTTHATQTITHTTHHPQTTNNKQQTTNNKQHTSNNNSASTHTLQSKTQKHNNTKKQHTTIHTYTYPSHASTHPCRPLLTTLRCYNASTAHDVHSLHPFHTTRIGLTKWSHATYRGHSWTP